MIKFLLDIAMQTFRDYFKALSFLSYSLVIIFASILKYIILTFSPETYPGLKPFIQLSIFLFIPLMLILVFTKFKRETLIKGVSFQPQLPLWASIMIMILLHIVLVVLFTYIIVVQ